MLQHSKTHSLAYANQWWPFATVVPVKFSTKLSSRSPLFSNASCNASGIAAAKAQKYTTKGTSEPNPS